MTKTKNYPQWQSDILEPLPRPIRKHGEATLNGQTYIRRDPETGEAIGFLFVVFDDE